MPTGKISYQVAASKGKEYKLVDYKANQQMDIQKGI